MELHDVVQARHLGGHTIEVAFDDGLTGTFDLSEYVDFDGVFAVLSEPAEVAKLKVEGGTVCWPSGADLAPEVLYEHIESLAGSYFRPAAEVDRFAHHGVAGS